MQNNEIFQEGLRLRPVRLYRAGALNTELWNIFADDPRIPSLNWGDITACVAALHKADDRMQRLAQRYGCAAVASAIDGTLARTERITREVLGRIPAGDIASSSFSGRLYQRSAGAHRAASRVAWRWPGDPGLHRLRPAGAGRLEPADGVDEASSVSVARPYQLVVTKSDAIHINAGIQRCIDLVLPEASVVNARFPAACGMRFTTAMRFHDLVMGALTKALPGVGASRRWQHTCCFLSLDLGTG